MEKFINGLSKIVIGFFGVSLVAVLVLYFYTLVKLGLNFL